MRRLVFRRRFPRLIGLLLVPALMGGGGPTPTVLRVAVVQFRSSRDLRDNVERIRGHLSRCAAEGARVVVFPECALTGYFADSIVATSAEELAEAERRVGESCRENHVLAVVGAPSRLEGKLFNSAVVFDSAGRVIERYHKIQLAESWPTAGDHLSVFRVAGVPCSIIICHDERYPELVRLPVLAGSRLVFYVSHESGLRQESKRLPYRAQIQARAVENSVFIAQSNAPANDDLTGSHGESRIIAPDGNVVKEASQFEEDVLIVDLPLKKATAANALHSIDRGPLADWWKEGLKRVRVIP